MNTRRNRTDNILIMPVTAGCPRATSCTRRPVSSHHGNNVLAAKRQAGGSGFQKTLSDLVKQKLEAVEWDGALVRVTTPVPVAILQATQSVLVPGVRHCPS
ncbi:hypothetical protein P4O66_011527 [Electrophorus voltai]|uniref:Uncharacterized protein n=1 Tax=Electrophorus voltai TaxID=2609070 RepID=A0AAD8Z604_9TELE|nr:hypothetical protein P4O66_011527 [Electrophorus voltai]